MEEQDSFDMSWWLDGSPEQVDRQCEQAGLRHIATSKDSLQLIAG